MEAETVNDADSPPHTVVKIETCVLYRERGVVPVVHGTLCGIGEGRTLYWFLPFEVSEANWPFGELGSDGGQLDVRFDPSPV